MAIEDAGNDRQQVEVLRIGLGDQNRCEPGAKASEALRLSLLFIANWIAKVGNGTLVTTSDSSRWKGWPGRFETLGLARENAP